MIAVNYDSNTKKIKLNGSFPLELVNSLKKVGYRSSGKSGELTCSSDIYLNTKSMLGTIYESEKLLLFIQSLKELELENKLKVKEYIDTKQGPFTLFKFQEEFVHWYNDPSRNSFSCFNALECGLGKTVSTLTAIFSTKPNCPLIIICPRNAIGTWKWHLEKFKYSLPIHLEFKPGECACICTYEAIPPRIEEALEKKSPLKDFKKDIIAETVLIADEFHLTKNPKALKTLRFRELFKYIREKNGKTIALTATPVLNRPVELKILLDNLDLFKKTFGNANNFYELFGGEFNYHLRRMIWDTSKRKPEEIRTRVHEVLFIRKKSEVLEQLPERIDTFMPVEIGKKSLKKELDAFQARFKDATSLLQRISKVDLVQYTLCRQALSIEKYKNSLETIEHFEEAEKPILVFSDFLFPIDSLGSRPGWKSITGATSALKRTEYEGLFNAGRLKGLAITIRAGGVALNLPSTDTVIFLDLNLTPGLNTQARQRNDRVNKFQEKLNYIYFYTNHPLEKSMMKLLSEKTSLESDIF